MEVKCLLYGSIFLMNIYSAKITSSGCSSQWLLWVVDTCSCVGAQEKSVFYYCFQYM